VGGRAFRLLAKLEFVVAETRPIELNMGHANHPPMADEFFFRRKPDTPTMDRRALQFYADR